MPLALEPCCLTRLTRGFQEKCRPWFSVTTEVGTASLATVVTLDAVLNSRKVSDCNEGVPVTV